MSIPVFDRRAASAFFADALALARLYCPQWGLPDDDAVTADAIVQDPGLVLLKLFSLLGQDLANVQNAIPVQRQLALYRFLDMALRPAVCASAPVRFSLAPQHASVFLPKGTVIGDSSTPRLHFETDRNLQVLPATLCAALTVEPRLDRYWDVQSLWAAGDAAPVFPGGVTERIEHAFAHCLLLGDAALFKFPSAASRMTITLRGGGLTPDYFQRWYDGALNSLPVTVSSSPDATVCTIGFSAMPTAAAQAVAALDAALSARAGRPVGATDPSTAGYPSLQLNWLVCEPADDVRVVPALSGYLPRIDTVWCDFGALSTMPQQAAVNGIAVDLKNGAFAFGKTPAVDDCFGIRCDAAFSQPGAPIVMTIDLAPLAAEHTAELEWQYWNGAWRPLDDTDDPYQFVDNTRNLAAGGTISFICPPIAQTSVAANQGMWIRAVLNSGDYGDTKSGFDPPFVRSLAIEYRSGGVPSSLWAHNAFELDALPAAPYEPYRPPADEGAAFYLGFEAPDLLVFGLGQPLTLYFDIAPADEHIGHGDAGTWQWLDASSKTWQPLAIDIGEAGLARSGVISFNVPNQLQAAVLFSRTACWFRVLCPHRQRALRLRGLYPNAVGVCNRTTYRNEILGSSNGQPGQRFVLNRVSATAAGKDQVLLAVSEDPQYAVQILVVEPASPDSVAISTSQMQQSTAYRWTRVDSFIGLGPNDRVFTVDVINGAIVFGDGHQGKIPPPGANNVIAACYAMTRGAGGNVAAGELAVLYSATAGVTQVTNPVPARGGVDADRVDDLTDSGPALVRANDRAVTVADVEALARAADAGVCRVRAIEHTVAPMLEFELPGESPVPPAPIGGGVPLSGTRGWPRLELVVLAVSSEPEPLTPMSMLDDVLTYVRARSMPSLAARMTARRPSFKRIDVAVLLRTNVPKPLWPELQTAIAVQLARFLHPALGGAAAKGWPIGEPVRYVAVHSFLLASQAPVTAVMALTLCGQTSDVALKPHEAPAAGSIDVRLAEASQS